MKTAHFLFLNLLISGLIFSLICLPEKTLALDTNWSISAPATVAFTPLTWNLSQQESIIDFSSPVTVTNSQVSTTGFTAQISSSELIHETDETLFMGYTSLEVKTGEITSDQLDGLAAAINGTYSGFSGVLSTSDPVTIMTADDRVRLAGSWSVTPTLRLTVPAKQKVGNYVSTVTFSLI